MEKVLKQYFLNVFVEDFFVVALDRTGCYLFSSNPDDSVVEQQFNSFITDMHLTKKQVSLCVIGRKSKFNYCDLQHLSEYVLKAKQRRNSVLKSDEIESILESYGIEQSSEVYCNNYSRTGLYKELEAYRDAHNLSVSDSQLNQLCREKHEGMNTSVCIDLPAKCARGLLAIVAEWDSELVPERTEEPLSTVVRSAGLDAFEEYRVQRFLVAFGLGIAGIVFAATRLNLLYFAMVFILIVGFVIAYTSKIGIFTLLRSSGMLGFLSVASKVYIKAIIKIIVWQCVFFIVFFGAKELLSRLGYLQGFIGEVVIKAKGVLG